jgi:hypothetical protein
MISLHFSGNQCITSSLTFETDQLEAWKSMSFKEKETTATSAFLEDSWPNPKEPIYRRLKLISKAKTLCPENFLIIGYTQVSGFVPVPKHLKTTVHTVKWETVVLQKAKHSKIDFLIQKFFNLKFLKIYFI